MQCSLRNTRGDTKFIHVKSGILDTHTAVGMDIHSSGSAEPTTPSANGRRGLNRQGADGTVDVSIYFNAGVAPAADDSDADFKSSRPGNTETVVIASPLTTTYYARVVEVTTQTKLLVIGTYTMCFVRPKARRGAFPERRVARQRTISRSGQEIALVGASMLIAGQPSLQMGGMAAWMKRAF